LSAATALHVHRVLGACLAAAVRKKLLGSNPIDDVETVPVPAEFEHEVLDDDQLRTLVKGFRTSAALFPLVCVLAFTGCRRNEALALQWTDLDVAKRTLRIERAWEETKAHGLRLKGPKRESHKRTIAIDDELIAVLVTQREKHQRLFAGIPDNAAVDLSLVKLPDDALMFPALPEKGEPFTLTKPRDPRNTSKEFRRKVVKLGFKDLRLHDLRGSHETCLLDAGVSVHVVAARCAHDPAVLLRVYARRTRKADVSAADAIATLSKGGRNG
jgi:integrase